MKFILIRGHSGSGKSTFALQKIKEYVQNDPTIKYVLYLENDLLLDQSYNPLIPVNRLDFLDKEYSYKWSVKALTQAQKRSESLFREYLKRKDVLIVNANVNQKFGKVDDLVRRAKKHGFEVEIYRLHNFFQNRHGVENYKVIDMYLNLERNPYPNEIHIDPVYQGEMIDEIKKIINFDRTNLPLNEEYNSYVTSYYLDHTKSLNLWFKKQSNQYPNLSVYKYRSNVFFDADWDRALMDMRGVVLDENNNIIVQPFRKRFNYSELPQIIPNYKLSDAHRVQYVRKVNGFLGCVTYHPDYGVLYSTTGSLDSDFAKMVEKHCSFDFFKDHPFTTFCFEVNDENDPHIIKEETGVTLIGMLHKGNQCSEEELDEFAKIHSLKRPERCFCTFGELKDMLKKCKHEGFMVFPDGKDHNDVDFCFKMKSPYYLINKLFARCKKSDQILKHFKSNKVEEEFLPLLKYIEQNFKAFIKLSEQERLKFMQDFLEDF